MEKIKYVLVTEKGNYFVEYLLKEIIFTNSISLAMVFDDFERAEKFKDMLYTNFFFCVFIEEYKKEITKENNAL